MPKAAQLLQLPPPLFAIPEEAAMSCAKASGATSAKGLSKTNLSTLQVYKQKTLCNNVYLLIRIGICGLLDQCVTKMHSLPGQRCSMVFQNIRRPRVLDTAPDTLHWSGR